eukprot:3580381-Pleurochrysis_carterae.AAC.1
MDDSFEPTGQSETTGPIKGQCRQLSTAAHPFGKYEKPSSNLKALASWLDKLSRPSYILPHIL